MAFLVGCCCNAYAPSARGDTSYQTTKFANGGGTNDNDDDDDEVHPSQKANKRDKTLKILVKVPKDLPAGTTFDLRIENVPGSSSREKRYLSVTIPKGGASSQFHVEYNMEDTFVKGDPFVEKQRLDKKQNWHDNPLAYAAPMAVLPFI